MSSHPKYDLPVLVVGAGPSGLVAALSLLQNNVPVRLVERTLTPRVGFKGAGIQPRSLELYRAFGLGPEILEKSSPFPVTRRYDVSQGTHVDFRLAPVLEATPDSPYRNSRRLDQGSHEGFLRSQLAKYDCHVEFNLALESFEQYDDHVVVHLVKENGQKETASFAYVISSDGGKSTTRKLLGFEFQGDTHANRSMFGDIRIEGGLDRDHWHMWQNPEKLFNILSLCYTGNENIFGVVMFANTPEGEAQLPTDRESVIEIFRNVIGPNEIKFGELLNAQEWRPNIRMVDRFHKGRVFLAGDAAHIHSPTGGQGLNSSIQDSHNLAWKLSLCYHGLASEKLLETYTMERHPVISQMLKTTTALLKATLALGTPASSKPVTSPESPPATSSQTSDPVPQADSKVQSSTPAANLGVAFQRGGKLNMLGVNYRGSSILVDERNPHSQQQGEANDYYDSTKDGLLCAGDRAPDAPALTLLEGLRRGDYGTEVSLFDIFRATRHTTLVFNAKADEVKDLVSTLQSRQTQVPQVICWVLSQDTDATPFGMQTTGAGLVLHDYKNYAYSHYAVPQDEAKPTVVIVRPDGVIGAVVLSGAEGVEKYFTKLVGL